MNKRHIFSKNNEHNLVFSLPTIPATQFTVSAWTNRADCQSEVAAWRVHISLWILLRCRWFVVGWFVSSNPFSVCNHFDSNQLIKFHSCQEANLPFFDVSLIVGFVQFLAKLIQKFLQTLLLGRSLFKNAWEVGFIAKDFVWLTWLTCSYSCCKLFNSSV